MEHASETLNISDTPKVLPLHVECKKILGEYSKQTFASDFASEMDGTCRGNE